ncbi:MAG: ABC transporter ATP-binding protein [Sphingobacteriales bacterium]|nr:MAG: ABC transporter ATP-binding protein [Sphingobacteriales bacterium]
MIQLNALAHSFNPSTELFFPDWEIKTGQQYLLLGKSGSGKTTLIHILTGLLHPQKGKIIINNTDIYALSTRNLDSFRGKNIGIVFQQPHLIKSLTIYQNIEIAQSFAGIKLNKQHIMQVLETLQIAHKSKNYPYQLSQGQLQRVAIARAIINKPTLLVADEPTSSLDDENAAIVLQLLKHISQTNGSTLIVATHDNRVKQAFTNQYLLQ